MTRHPTADEIADKVFVRYARTSCRIRAVRGVFYYKFPQRQRRFESTVVTRDLYLVPWLSDLLASEAGRSTHLDEALSVVTRAVRRNPRLGGVVAEVMALAGEEAAWRALREAAG